MRFGKSVWAAIIMAAGVSVVIGSPAYASVYGDDLNRCATKATTDADNFNLMKWMFATFSANPQLAPMAKVTAADRARYAESFTSIIERIILTDCRAESKAVLKYGEEGELLSVFKTMSVAAVRMIMADPAVTASLQQLDQFRHAAEWDKLAKEAAVPMLRPDSSKPDARRPSQ